jgi:pimeloyl-ACP methyl ester carboxylesterase
MPFLDFPDCRLNCEITGTGKPALVFVHGGFCDHRDWALQVDLLRHDFTVVTYDQRCHGASTAELKSCSVERFARDVHMLIDRLALGPAIVVGHSLGARVTIQAAAHRADDILGIVLVDGSRLTTGTVAEVAQKQARHLGTDPRAYLAARFESMFFDNADPALKARVIDTASRTPAETAQVIADATALWDATGLEPALSAIPPSLPALAIQSTFIDQTTARYTLGPDTKTTPWLDLLKIHMPQLEIAITPGVGHFNMLEAPVPVADAIRSFAQRLGTA